MSNESCSVTASGSGSTSRGRLSSVWGCGMCSEQQRLKLRGSVLVHAASKHRLTMRLDSNPHWLLHSCTKVRANDISQSQDIYIKNTNGHGLLHRVCFSQFYGPDFMVLFILKVTLNCTQGLTAAQRAFILCKWGLFPLQDWASYSLLV